MESGFHQPYKDAGLLVLGIAGGLFNDTDELLREFRDQTGATFPIAWDDGSRSAWAFPSSISPYPRQVVLDRDGTVLYLATEHRADALAEVIEATLALQPARSDSKLR